MSFKVPDWSSSPTPSTPEKRTSNIFSFAASNNPSTTPAGPPPSSAGSFTPAGPPPSSYYGSSQINSVKPLPFTNSNLFSAPQSSPPAAYGRSPLPRQRSGLANEYDPSRSEHEEEDEEREGEEYSDEEGSRQYDDEQSYDDEGDNMMEEVDAEHDDEEDEDMDYESDRPQGYGQRGMFSTAGDLKHSRGDGLNKSMSESQSRHIASRFETISKGLYTQMGVPAVEESDDLVLSTEGIITKLYSEGIGATDEEDMLQEALGVIPGELITLWEQYHKNTTSSNSEEYMSTIGPGPGASDFAKANFIAGLALRIHHPPRISRIARSFEHKTTPLPQILLEWMEHNHRPYESQVDEVKAHRPSPANHRLFWDTIFNSLLRGKVVEVVNLMNSAGLEYAREGNDELGRSQHHQAFSGVVLNNVQRVVDAAVQVLASCPAAKGDWNIRSSDWAFFRLRATQSLEDLRNFAEGKKRGRLDGYDSTVMGESTYRQKTREAESQIPWSIYEHLTTFYTLIIGEKSALLTNSQDWLEATIGLHVWWNDSKDDRRLARSQTSRPLNRDSDEEAYLRKLRKSFENATDSELQVNSADEVEIALASLFEGDNKSVIGFLRGWSGTVASAVAEIASLGGWLPQAAERPLINMGGLDQDDLDLLGLNSSPSKTDGVKDATLIEYAGALSERGQLRSSSRPQIIREGWELSIAVLGRLDSTTRSEEMVGDFLKRFQLESSNTVDKLWRLLNDLGMGRHAEDTAESYADYLAEESHRYGEAVWYYALAHKSLKVKNVLDLLISYSLIQSTAFPSKDEMDDYLKNIVSSPRTALTEMSQMDTEAAELLHKSLSGYATLRKFYDLRDEAVLSNGKTPTQGAIARKREAANSLMAVIISSDDNICGGLYDEERGAVVSVDFLLALLGEAMVFVNQPDYTATVAQIDILLKAIEDLQAVGPRVYSACTEFLQTVVASGQGLKGSTPSDLLRKQPSNISGTSGSFSMVGSSMLASQLKQSMSSSGVLVKGNVKRGWDWRKGISAGTYGDDLLKILRLGLAQDLAKAWLAEADGRM